MENLLEIRHLIKKFDNHIVLNDINLSINKGEVLVILGASGCGKSTLLRCINGLEKTDSGEIIFKGNRINTKETNLTMIRQKIGMVFQSYELFPHMSVLENIILAPLKVEKRQRNEVIDEACKLLERFNLISKKDSMPSSLSGGQKQRVAIIRALCMNPEIILFDEVTASLDPEMAYEVSNVILELAKDGMTMIIVTHEMKFAKTIASKIIFLDNGIVAEASSPKEFFNNPQSPRAKNFLNIFG